MFISRKLDFVWEIFYYIYVNGTFVFYLLVFLKGFLEGGLVGRSGLFGGRF